MIMSNTAEHVKLKTAQLKSSYSISSVNPKHCSRKHVFFGKFDSHHTVTPLHPFSFQKEITLSKRTLQAHKHSTGKSVFSILSMVEPTQRKASGFSTWILIYHVFVQVTNGDNHYF